MANELRHAHNATGQTLYAVIRNTTGQCWNTTGTPAFETQVNANWVNGEYDIVMTETPAGGYYYIGSLPASNMGTITVDIYQKVGASHAVSDPIVGGFEQFAWDGSVQSPADCNVTHVNGEAVVVATEFDANLVKIDSDAQSMTDLKDFADTGYNPATSSVVLVDTTTTNTDVRGTDGANTVVPDVAGTAASLHSTTDGLIGGLNDFDAANDTVALVTLVTTTTTNTDMIVLDTDGTNRVRVAEGTGSGELSLSSGVIASNLEQIKGQAQSATDLQDFTDSGYNPVTHSVVLVDLVTTTTTNSDMVGEPAAALVAINLDHFMAVADSDDVVDDSALAKVASKTGDWSTFDKTTDSLEAIRDQVDATSSSPSMLLSAEITSVTSQTVFVLATGADFDDAYDNLPIVFYDDTNNDYPSQRYITAYTGATKTLTINEAPDFTVGADDSVKIFVASGTVDADAYVGAFPVDVVGNAPTGSSVTLEHTTLEAAPDLAIELDQNYAWSKEITATESQLGKVHAFAVYEREDKDTELWSLDDSHITVGGTGDKTLTVADDDANTGTAGTFYYELANTTNDVLITAGSLTIKERGDTE